MSRETFFAGIAFGAVVGAASAYFLAPQSGDEFKEELSKKGKKAKHKTISATEDALDKASEWLDKTSQEQENIPKVYDVPRDTVGINHKPSNSVVEEAYTNL